MVQDNIVSAQVLRFSALPHEDQVERLEHMEKRVTTACATRLQYINCDVRNYLTGHLGRIACLHVVCYSYIELQKPCRH